jgi:hypothetical protein
MLDTLSARLLIYSHLAVVSSQNNLMDNIQAVQVHLPELVALDVSCASVVCKSLARLIPIRKIVQMRVHSMLLEGGIIMHVLNQLSFAPLVTLLVGFIQVTVFVYCGIDDVD